MPASRNNKKLLREILDDYELYRAYTSIAEEGIKNKTIFTGHIEAELEDLTELLLRRGEFPKKLAFLKYDYNYLTADLLEYITAEYEANIMPINNNIMNPGEFNEI